MARMTLRPATMGFLALNFIMYVVVLVISSWAMNKIIDHQSFGAGENAATTYFVLFSLLASVVGTAACSFGMQHINEWGAHSLPAASSSAGVAWSFTALALGFAGKHIKLHTSDVRLKIVETLISILSGTMLVYLFIISKAAKRAHLNAQTQTIPNEETKTLDIA